MTRLVGGNNFNMVAIIWDYAVLVRNMTKGDQYGIMFKFS